MDDERLRGERRDRKSWKSRVSGLNDYDEPHTKPRKRERNNGNRNAEDDLEMKLAIEASKNEAEEEARRRAGKAAPEDDDDDLAKALKLSKEEEELRKRQLEEANANSLFDTTPAPSQPTGWNQGYQQQPTVDWFGNVIDQQPQHTGYPQQATGMQNGYGYPNGMQPQATGYNASFMQPQQTAFNTNNPYGQQQNAFGAFGQQATPQQPEQGVQPGSNNPWAGNNHAGVQDSMAPQPTGSNNPFAQSFNRPQPQAARQPTLNSLAEQNATTAFNPIMNYASPSSPVHAAQQPQQQQQPVSFPSYTSPIQQSAKPQDPHHARLNALLSSGDGQDTFGNVGDLRIPAQHTAPGTFVNSAGANLGRLTNTATGNPFLSSQYTGMPQQNRLPPAQTGPAGAYGNNNPFSHGQQNNQGGNLIDL
jgi:epsin